jgi:hypothetical protein
MTKKILFQGVPDSVLSETLGSVYPAAIDKQANGQLTIGAQVVVPYDPLTGSFVEPSRYNPSTGLAESQRTPTVWKKSALIASIGATALWTPAAAKRIRLMGFSVVVDPATTTAAGSLVTVADGATGLDDVIALPIAATNNPFRAAGILPSNGWLLPVGDVLNVILSAAATAGGVYVNAWGCEE